MKKEQRSNKWAFIIYKESVPENYLEVLEGLHVPFVLSPWHDKDVNTKSGEIKKAHKHGALYFDSLKSYSQVSELISSKLNGPSHVEPVMSPKGMYDYFVHAENPEKTPYDIKDIESGAGFDLEKFLIEQDSDAFNRQIIKVIEENNFIEFRDLVISACESDTRLLRFIIKQAYFVTKYLDSRRFSARQNKNLVATDIHDNQKNEKEADNDENSER